MMRKILYLICGLVAGAIIGCSTPAMAEQDKPLKIWFENKNGQMETWCIVDEETNVNYIVVAPCFSKGSHYGGVAITERRNPDGSLYVSK